MFSQKFYECRDCPFFCKYMSDWKRHISSQKHIKKTSVLLHNPESEKNQCFSLDIFKNDCINNLKSDIVKDTPPVSSCKKLLVKSKSKIYGKEMPPTRKSDDKCYKCVECNKNFKSYNSLWYHRNKYKCEKTIDIDVLSDISVEEDTAITQLQPSPSNNELIKDLLIQNAELRNFCIEQTQELKHFIMEFSKTNIVTNNNIINTINGNIQNNHFNINLFLNEKCKDAINFTDFIENVQITNNDIENNANLGFVNGMSKILLDNLKQMSIYERPIHCTDIKRETIYIKDEDKWEKENEDMKKLKTAFQEISRKNIMQITQWTNENPDYIDLDSDIGLKYIAMMKESMAGGNREIYHDKIIKNITKEIAIDKIKHKIMDS